MKEEGVRVRRPRSGAFMRPSIRQAIMASRIEFLSSPSPPTSLACLALAPSAHRLRPETALKERMEEGGEKGGERRREDGGGGSP